MEYSNIDKYMKIIIDEQDEFYVIRVVDSSLNVDLIKCLKDEIGEKNVRDLIKIFSDTFGVNGVCRSIPVLRSSHKNKEYSADVFCANGTKKIVMNIYNPKLRFVSKMILDKYLIERINFLKSNDFNDIRVNAIPDSSQFEVVGNVVNLTLNTDLNFNIISYEKEFLKELLKYKCGRRKIAVNLFDNENNGERLWVITCGEFRMFFPRGYTYSRILGLVYEHNLKIDEMRKRR